MNSKRFLFLDLITAALTLLPSVPLAWSQTFSSESQSPEKKSVYAFDARMTNRYDKAYNWLPAGGLALTDHFRTDLSLDISANKTGFLSGFGRLAMTKYWNSWLIENQPTDGVYNLNLDDKFKNDTVYVSEAYINYLPTDWFILTGGRLPTVDGSPVNYYKGDQAIASFPKLALGAELDGGMLTFKFDSLFPTKSHAHLVVAYAPSLLENYNYQTTPSSAKPVVSNGQVTAETLSPQAMAQLEYVLENGRPHHQFHALIHYRWMNSLRFPDGTIAQASFDPSLTGTATTSSNLAVSLRALTLHTEVDQVFEIPLDISLSFLSTALNSEGVVAVTSGPDSGRTLGGFGTSKSSDNLYGNKVLLAARYLTPWLSTNAPSLGVEYLTGTQDSFYYDRNPEDVTQFYGTKGQALHFYILEPLPGSFLVRLGYRRQDSYFTPTALGDTHGDGTRYDTYYADFRAEF